MLRYCTLLILLFATTLLTAQAGKYSEEEVKTERKFVDAKNLALVEKYEASLDMFLSFLKDEPHNAAAANEVSKLYTIKHDKTLGIDWAKKAVKWAPENEWYRMNLIDLYKENSDFEAAAIQYDDIIKKDPTDSYNYEKQAYMYVLGQMPEKAIASYDAYIEKIGMDKSIVLRKISLLGGMGQKEAAFGLLEKLDQDYPNDEDILFKIGEYYTRNDQKEKAKSYYDKVLAINPNHNRAHYALNNGGQKSNNGLADLISNEAIDIDIKINKLYPYLNDLVNGKKVDGNIFDLVQQLTKVHPSEAKAYALAGDFSLHKGYMDKALAYYDTALKNDQSVFDIWLQKMDILKSIGDIKALEKTSEKCIDLFPYKANAYLYNGIALNAQNKPKDALSSLRAALPMSRKSPEIQSNIYVEIGMAYILQDNWSKGEENLDKAIKLGPENGNAFKQYAYGLMVANKDLKKAMQMAEKSVALEPQNPEYTLNYAFIAYSVEDYTKAKNILQPMIQQNGSNCSILEPYGDVHYQLGDIDSAVKFWQLALDSCPESKDLKQKIAAKKL